MSYLSDTIHELDVNTRILYNRTTTQIGLAAFCAGDYKGALSFLSDLYARGPRIKELLAQGVVNAWLTDAETAESKRRMYPYHLHINMDFLDAAHLIAAMLVEIPVIAEMGLQSQRRVASKFFRRLYANFVERSTNANIVPSIDTPRDAILCAAYNLSTGNWQRAVELIMDIKVLWSTALYTDSAENSKNLLIQQLKLASLKAYLLSGVNTYRSITLSTFEQKFELDKATIKQIINSSAYTEVIHAAWDSSSPNAATDPCLILSKNSTQANHRAALQFVDKLQSLQSTLSHLHQPHSYRR
eukprot:UN04684